MAYTSLTPTAIGRNEVVAQASASTDAADIKIPYGRDDKLLIEISAGTAGSVVIEKGNGYAAADEDLTVLSSATGTKYVVVETAKYGKDGYIYIDVTTHGQVRAYSLM